MAENLELSICLLSQWTHRVLFLSQNIDIDKENIMKRNSLTRHKKASHLKQAAAQIPWTAGHRLKSRHWKQKSCLYLTEAMKSYRNQQVWPIIPDVQDNYYFVLHVRNGHFRWMSQTLGSLEMISILYFSIPMSVPRSEWKSESRSLWDTKAEHYSKDAGMGCDDFLLEAQKKKTERERERERQRDKEIVEKRGR